MHEWTLASRQRREMSESNAGDAGNSSKQNVDIDAGPQCFAEMFLLLPFLVLEKSLPSWKLNGSLLEEASTCLYPHPLTNRMIWISRIPHLTLAFWWSPWKS